MDFNIEARDMERLLMLAGRMNAFAGYVKNCEFAIDRKTCASILGFTLEDAAGPVQEDVDGPDGGRGSRDEQISL